MNPDEIGPMGPIIAASITAVVLLAGTIATLSYNLYKDRKDRKHQQVIEERRQAIEYNRPQDSALQAFIDQMSQSDTYNELRTAAASGHKRALLRLKMQTLLMQLDEERKGVLLTYLHGAKLSRKTEITPYEYTKEGSKVKRKERWNYPILRLNDIDFSRTKRTPDTKLTFDDLRGIILRDAKLSKVNLRGANLSGADLSNSDLSGAQLSKATPQDSEMIPGESHNEYDKAVDKLDKLPPGLLETDLRGANLRGANLRGATGITTKELEDQAFSLEGATMPDGSKHS